MSSDETFQFESRFSSHPSPVNLSLSLSSTSQTGKEEGLLKIGAERETGRDEDCQGMQERSYFREEEETFSCFVVEGQTDLDLKNGCAFTHFAGLLVSAQIYVEATSFSALWRGV